MNNTHILKFWPTQIQPIVPILGRRQFHFLVSFIKTLLYCIGSLNTQERIVIRMNSFNFHMSIVIVNTMRHTDSRHIQYNTSTPCDLGLHSTAPRTAVLVVVHPTPWHNHQHPDTITTTELQRLLMLQSWPHKQLNDEKAIE